MPVDHRIAHQASDARHRAHLSAAREAPHVGLGDARERGVVLVKAVSPAGASVRVQAPRARTPCPGAGLRLALPPWFGAPFVTTSTS